VGREVVWGWARPRLAGCAARGEGGEPESGGADGRELGQRKVEEEGCAAKGERKERRKRRGERDSRRWKWYPEEVESPRDGRKSALPAMEERR